jgi:hypothetical protein
MNLFIQRTTFRSNVVSRLTFENQLISVMGKCFHYYDSNNIIKKKCMFDMKKIHVNEKKRGNCKRISQKNGHFWTNN